MSTQPQAHLITILAIYREECISKLEKLAKRAARYGQLIAWTETARVEQRGSRLVAGKPVPRMVEVIDLHITGEAPRVGDFVLEAALERTAGGVIISAAPGAKTGKLAREWDGRCDHCGSSRSRVHGFIVSKGRTRKVVGKSCLRDHLGTDAPASLAARFTILRELVGGGDEDGWSGYGGGWQDYTMELIAAARAAIKLFGWRPASFDGITTEGHVSLLTRTLTGKDDDLRKMRDQLALELETNAAAYHAQAEAIIAWTQQLRTSRSDYLHNLKVACSGEVVRPKQRGLVVSACAAFDKQKAVEEERKAEAAKRPESRWLGNVGQRVTKELELIRRHTLPDYGFGESIVFTFATPEGELLSWKTGSAPYEIRKMERGQKIAAKFTIKGHATFREQQETRISRLSPVASI